MATVLATTLLPYMAGLSWTALMASAPMRIYAANRVADLADSIVYRVSGCTSMYEQTLGMDDLERLRARMGMERRGLGAVLGMGQGDEEKGKGWVCVSEPEDPLPIASAGAVQWSHPALKQLEQQDFFAQVRITRALVRDLLRYLGKSAEGEARGMAQADSKELVAAQPVASAATTPIVASTSFEIALALVEQTLMDIYVNIQGLETVIQEHSKKWFASRRAVQLGPYSDRLVCLGQRLHTRTEQLLRYGTFWSGMR